MVLELSSDCPVTLSSSERSDIVNNARAVKEVQYHHELNISAHLEELDLSVIRGLISGITNRTKQTVQFINV